MKWSNGMKKTLLFLGVTALCAALVYRLYTLEPQVEIAQREETPPRPVSVIGVQSETRSARIKAFGEAFPRWETRLRSQVVGAVVHVNDGLQPGQAFKAGDLLVQVEAAPYRSALAEARRDLEDARVNLLQVQRRAAQARADWTRSGMSGEPSSPLVFYGPQVQAARARVTAANAAVIKAEKDLEHTRVVAPFDGMVVQRSVSRGDVLFSGDDLARLVSVAEMEIRVNVDWGQAAGLTLGSPVEIRETVTGRSWTGTLIRRAGQLDKKTRLQAFYVRPDQGGILPGMFVTVFLQGRVRSQLLGVPESALTRDGYLWYVDGARRLAAMTARVAFYQNGKAYVENTSGLDHLQVVVMPVQSFHAGARVTPQGQGSLAQGLGEIHGNTGSEG
ncbi:MAG: efflux RND transporter periplasmic adaptor subunit [Desulfobacterales bacterium]|nr:efflux RND transporter periplasmic adaptor subunit [Desulfobacterales bacterium]